MVEVDRPFQQIYISIQKFLKESQAKFFFVVQTTAQPIGHKLSAVEKTKLYLIFGIL